MVKLISYPFRLGTTGSVVTIDEGEEYYGDELAMLLKTIPGERELVPDYGIQDPTFSTFSNYELIEKISLFGPPVDIVSSAATQTSDGRVSINIDFEQREQEDFDVDEDEYNYEDYETDDSDEEYVDPAFDFTDDVNVLDGI